MNFRSLSGAMAVFFEEPGMIAGWWFQIFLEFSPLFGEDSHFDSNIFQNGLVQPPTTCR